MGSVSCSWKMFSQDAAQKAKGWAPLIMQAPQSLLPILPTLSFLTSLPH